MKSYLTENGILNLYSNQGHQAKVQVLFLTYISKFAFIRVTDFDHISPIIIIMKINDPFVVGDVLLIKKVQLQSPVGPLKETDCLPFLDADVNHLLILEYQVMTSRKNIKLVYQKNINDPENYYLKSLLLVKNYLIKADGMADAYFKELEKRVDLLKPDCIMLRERGNELYKEQKYIKALLHYEMAKLKDRFDPRVFNNCSQVHYCNKEYDKARIEALIALKLDPFNKKGYYRASLAMEKEGDYKGAEELVEAGLFMCGPSDDLEKILNTSKGCRLDSSKNNKRKVSNGETSESPAVNDFSAVHTPTMINNKKVNTVKAKESPNRKIKEVDNAKIHFKNNNNSSTSSISFETSSSILSFFKGARMLYEKGKYKDAIEVYITTTSKANVSLLSKQDMIIVKYLVEVCKILIGSELEAARSSLNSFLGTFPYPPAIHYWMANIYEILEVQDKMIYHANTCITLTESFQYNLVWPGTKDPIQDTMPDVLKKWFYEGTWRPAPFAKCRHKDCISIQGHNLAKSEIYLSDIDFRGFVEVQCEEDCSICYHPCCWKAMKENNDNRQLGKKTDKDFLGMRCFTPDCCGLICGIRIFDENSDLRNEIIKDKKEKKNSTISKPKKKKEKKKGSYQSGGKFDDKKKTKLSESEEVKSEKINEVIIEESGINKMSDAYIMGVQNDPINFDGADYKILRPNDDDQQNFQVQINKKNKNKSKKNKKKGKPAHINILTEEVEDKIVHNDYLSRLQALKSQQELFEKESYQTSSSGGLTAGLKFLSDCILDPEKPFYLPKHLQDNPLQLENYLRAKMVTTSSTDIEASSISTLLEFVYDWLKASNPMNVNDPRVKEYISENFPPNALTYVTKCGGIKNFLLQSFRFAIIDDTICVNEQVLAAQEIALQCCLEKFKSNKFLISDGHKAMKLSHLLDESKSSCSTNSSQSNNIFTSDSNSGLSRPDYSASATPYKTAAMASVLHTPPKDIDKAAELMSKLIRPKPQPPQSGTFKKNTAAKKPKLKTMNIDAFEVIESGEVGQLFSPQKPISCSNDKEFEKSLKGVTKGDMLFHSDEEMEDDIMFIQSKGNGIKTKSPNTNELRENICSLEAQLETQKLELAKIVEAKENITAQNQELNDRLSQIKIKSNVEITGLKKAKEEAQELAKIAETNLESFKIQKDGEVRKLISEKSKYLEEIKVFSLKIDSLQLTVDQLNSTKNHFEEEAKQKSIQLTEQQMRLTTYEDALMRHSERVKDAESKYLSMKKELMILHLDKTRKRLTAEINKMRELLSEATEETYPSQSSIIRAISEWDENIHKLHNSIQAITEDSNRFQEYIHSGRQLNSLPPGDLQLPTVPDLSVAKFLFVGNPISPKINEKFLGQSLSNSSLEAFKTFPNVSSSNMRSHGGLGGYSFGQLGVGATPRELGVAVGSLSRTPDALHSSMAKDLSLGQRNAFGSMKEASLIRKENALSGINSRLNEGLGIGSSIGTSGNRASNDHALLCGISSSHLENPLGMVGNKRVGDGIRATPRLNNSSATLMMNRVSSVSGLMGEEHVKGGSSESSPIQMPLYYSDSPHGTKDSKAESNQMFPDQFNWSYAEESLKPINFGSHSMNMQAMDIKHHAKMTNRSALGVQDLTLASPSTNSLHIQSMIPANKTVTTSAYGLQSLLDSSQRNLPSRTATASTTPTAPKPKFQNLRSNVNIGPIGTLPPKVVRPIPRPGSSNVLGLSGVHTVTKEDSLSISASYKRLIEECKQKFGNDYSETSIQKAIKDVREHNKNSLSGLALETILEQVELQLRSVKRLPSKPSVAPWAQMGKDLLSGNEWQGRGIENIKEDDCSICMERLSAKATMPLQCRHVFHIECIKHWLSKKSDCPICRKFALNSDDFPSLSSH